MKSGFGKVISESRKIRKPLMEKKRRARINDSLETLKQILLDSKTTLKESKSGQRTAKLEKADILEMTVRYLQYLRRKVTTEDKYQLSKESDEESKPIDDIKMVRPDDINLVHSNDNSMIHSDHNSVIHSNDNSMIHSDDNSMIHSDDNSMIHSDDSDMVHSDDSNMMNPDYINTVYSDDIKLISRSDVRNHLLIKDCLSKNFVGKETLSDLSPVSRKSSNATQLKITLVPARLENGQFAFILPPRFHDRLREKEMRKESNKGENVWRPW